MASPLTVWSTTADAYCYSEVTDSWAGVRNATTVGLSSNSTASSWIGAYGSGSMREYEVFLDFDTSSVGADSTVTEVTMSLYPAGYDTVTGSLDLQARLDDWGPAYTDADFVTADSFTGATLLCHRTVSGTDWNTGTYNAFTDDAFPANVAKTGTTYVVVADSYFTADEPEPGADLSQKAYLAEDTTGGGGTDRDPKLYVEWTEGGEPAAFTGVRITRHLG